MGWELTQARGENPVKRIVLAVCLAWAGLININLAPAQAPADPPPISMDLFNGRNLDGWVFFPEFATQKVEEIWKVENGVLSCTNAGRSYLRTLMPYADYQLELEWRWPSNAGNSGVMLHIVNQDVIWPKCVEAQLQATHAGDFYMFSDARSPDELVARNPNGVSTGRLVRKGPSLEKPTGEWNRYDILVEGSTITLTVNGQLANKITNITPTAGMIGLQAEGTAVEFRNVKLKSLPPLKNLRAPLPPAGG